MVFMYTQKFKSDEKTDELEEKYHKFIKNKIFFLFCGILILFLLILVGTCIGSADLSIKDVFYSLFSRLIQNSQLETFNDAVVWDLRLPRIIMGVVAGMGLALAGTQMQGITQNPLVSPFTIGISSAAALGASIAIMFGIGFIGSGSFIIILNAFIFAMICAFLVLGLSNFKGTSPETMILAGIALTYLFSSVTSMLHYFASEEQLMAMIHWTFGTLTGVSWYEIYIVSFVLILCIPIFLKYSWDLNALSVGGDENARSLGVNTKKIRIISLVLSSFLTATIISFTGIIGFVGLVAPHIARFIIGGDHRFLIPGSFIIGAIIMVCGDIISRTVLSPIIIPIGIIISFIGVPMFLYLLLTKKQKFWTV